MPKTNTAKLLVEQAISQLQTTSAALAALKQEMQSLAASLPEYPVVMEMFGVGPTLGPQLIAEIGDVRRFHSKKALVAFAGIDAPPYQSGQIDVRSRSISKRGSASLRRTLFLVMGVLLQCAPMDEPVYDKWSEEYFKTLKSDGSSRAVTSAWKYCSAVYDMRVMDVRARHVKGCMDEGVATVRGKEQHASASMKNKIKSLFNLMLDYALEYEIVDRNYSRTFKLTDETIKEIQKVKKEHIPFTDEEISKLWEHVDDKNFVDVILIQCYSGWRPQELGLIELANVDLENGTFKGGIKTEAGEDRVVPIHSKIRYLVERHYNKAKEIGSPYLFNCKDKRSGKTVMMSYQRYKAGFEMIRDELNLNPEHRPHDGRKHFVTAAKKAGIDEYAIKYMVGHKISDITEKVYTQREFDWLKEEIEKIK